MLVLSNGCEATAVGVHHQHYQADSGLGIYQLSSAYAASAIQVAMGAQKILMAARKWASGSESGEVVPGSEFSGYETCCVFWFRDLMGLVTT